MELDYRELRRRVRAVLEEELGMQRQPVEPRWHGGRLLLKPADSALQPKEIPLDAFFKKTISVREKLRVIEQKCNNNKQLTPEEKIELQRRVTRVYDSLAALTGLLAEPPEE